MNLHEIALAELGTTEVAGPQHNSRIQLYHDFTTLDAEADEIAWCAAFVNFCIATKWGLDPNEYLALGRPGTGRANARSFMDFGVSVAIPRAGDIAVFWRESPQSWKGHVGIVHLPDDGRGNILLLGGNQSNCVCIKAYDQDRLLGLRSVGDE